MDGFSVTIIVSGSTCDWLNFNSINFPPKFNQIDRIQL